MVVFCLGMLWHLAVGFEIQVLGLRGRWVLTALVMFLTSYLGATVIRSIAVDPSMALPYAVGSMLGGLMSKALMRRLTR